MVYNYGVPRVNEKYVTCRQTGIVCLSMDLRGLMINFIWYYLICHCIPVGNAYLAFSGSLFMGHMISKQIGKETGLLSYAVSTTHLACWRDFVSNDGAAPACLTLHLSSVAYDDDDVSVNATSRSRAHHCCARKSKLAALCDGPMTRRILNSFASLSLNTSRLRHTCLHGLRSTDVWATDVWATVVITFELQK